MAMVYIEPNDGGITDVDFADKDDPGLIDNLSGKPTQRSGGACLTDGRRINNRCEGSETVSNKGLQTPRWVRDGLLLSTNEFFPESNYLLYKNIAAELFEKIVDEEALELIVIQTIL